MMIIVQRNLKNGDFISCYQGQIKIDDDVIVIQKDTMSLNLKCKRLNRLLYEKYTDIQTVVFEVLNLEIPSYLKDYFFLLNIFKIHNLKEFYYFDNNQVRLLIQSFYRLSCTILLVDYSISDMTDVQIEKKQIIDFIFRVDNLKKPIILTKKDMDTLVLLNMHLKEDKTCIISDNLISQLFKYSVERYMMSDYEYDSKVVLVYLVFNNLKKMKEGLINGDEKLISQILNISPNLVLKINDKLKGITKDLIRISSEYPIYRIQVENKSKILSTDIISDLYTNLIHICKYPVIEMYKALDNIIFELKEELVAKSDSNFLNILMVYKRVIEVIFKTNLNPFHEINMVLFLINDEILSDHFKETSSITYLSNVIDIYNIILANIHDEEYILNYPLMVKVILKLKNPFIGCNEKNIKSKAIGYQLEHNCITKKIIELANLMFCQLKVLGERQLTTHSLNTDITSFVQLVKIIFYELVPAFLSFNDYQVWKSENSILMMLGVYYSNIKNIFDGKIDKSVLLDEILYKIRTTNSSILEDTIQLMNIISKNLDIHDISWSRRCFIYGLNFSDNILGIKEEYKETMDDQFSSLNTLISNAPQIGESDLLIATYSGILQVRDNQLTVRNKYGCFRYPIQIMNSENGNESNQRVGHRSDKILSFLVSRGWLLSKVYSIPKETKYLNIVNDLDSTKTKYEFSVGIAYVPHPSSSYDILNFKTLREYISQHPNNEHPQGYLNLIEELGPSFSNKLIKVTYIEASTLDGEGNEKEFNFQRNLGNCLVNVYYNEKNINGYLDSDSPIMKSDVNMVNIYLTKLDPKGKMYQIKTIVRKDIDDLLLKFDKSLYKLDNFPLRGKQRYIDLDFDVNFLKQSLSFIEKGSNLARTVSILSSFYSIVTRALTVCLDNTIQQRQTKIERMIDLLYEQSIDNNDLMNIRQIIEEAV